LKNTVEDEEKGIGEKIEEAEKKELMTLIDETLDWLEENQEAEADDFTEKQKEVEKVANPIMRKVYQSTGGAPGGGAPEEDEDDEL
jgi:molecular chaperone DnaK (HSP70)